jgi:hypothetical protein
MVMAVAAAEVGGPGHHHPGLPRAKVVNVDEIRDMHG